MIPLSSSGFRLNFKRDWATRGFPFQLPVCMAPNHTTEELLAQYLEEAKAQTAILERITRIQEENGTKLLALLVASGKQLDQLETQAGLLDVLLDTLKGKDLRQVTTATEDIEPTDADRDD